MKSLRHVQLLSFIGCVAVACAGRGRAFAAEDPPAVAPADADAKQERKKKLEDMRRLAESTIVSSLAGKEKAPAKLVAEPVLRYDSQFHGIRDATVWVYGDKGRPLAVQKVEFYRAPYLTGYYYGLASLSDGLIETRWAGDPAWSSTKPGVEMQALPGGPKAAATPAGRLLQMKDQVRRFSATRINAGDIREENRLLSRPIHRYNDPAAGLQDGAIFAFVANGSNPDFFLVLELRGPDLARATWSYGQSRLTTGELRLRLDDKVVWSVPWEWVSGRNEYPTYVHFRPTQQESNR